VTGVKQPYIKWRKILTEGNVTAHCPRKLHVIRMALSLIDNTICASSSDSDADCFIFTGTVAGLHQDGNQNQHTGHLMGWIYRTLLP
jgi:hypothetical protein